MRISPNGELRDSAPCMDCYIKMQELGVKNIIYSTNESVVKLRLDEYTPQTISLGRFYIRSGFSRSIKRSMVERETAEICFEDYMRK